MTRTESAGANETAAAGRALSAAELPGLIAAAYNAGDAAAIEELFEPDAVMVVNPGVPAVGDERRQANAEFLKIGGGLHFTITARHVFHSGDIALLIADHVAEGVGPDGRPLRLAGTATDVVRRGPDGYWRYLIDNPWGVDKAFDQSN
jgi:ketosteroid isomerase-like protein